jgi:hypothetical protein
MYYNLIFCVIDNNILLTDKISGDKIVIYKILILFLFIIQSGERIDPVFELVLINQPCNKRCFVT